MEELVKLLNYRLSLNKKYLFSFLRIVMPGLIAFIVYTIYFFYHDGDLKIKNTDDLRNYALFATAVLAIPFAIIIGWIANKAANSAVENSETAKKAQVTTSFTAAITQFGDKELSIRLGGIYALRKIAEDHPESYKDVVGNTLQAFIRSTSKYELTETEEIKEDIAAALASLVGLRIKRISLPFTVLNRADLKNAYLKGANLQASDLKDANLEGADLRGALNLTVEQLLSAGSTEDIQLDPDLQEKLEKALEKL